METNKFKNQVAVHRQKTLDSLESAAAIVADKLYGIVTSESFEAVVMEAAQLGHGSCPVPPDLLKGVPCYLPFGDKGSQSEYTHVEGAPVVAAVFGWKRDRSSVVPVPGGNVVDRVNNMLKLLGEAYAGCKIAARIAGIAEKWSDSEGNLHDHRSIIKYTYIWDDEVHNKWLEARRKNAEEYQSRGRAQARGKDQSRGKDQAARGKDQSRGKDQAARGKDQSRGKDRTQRAAPAPVVKASASNPFSTLEVEDEDEDDA
jgi:hypothetical protein